MEELCALAAAIEGLAVRGLSSGANKFSVLQGRNIVIPGSAATSQAGTVNTLAIVPEYVGRFLADQPSALLLTQATTRKYQHPTAIGTCS